MLSFERDLTQLCMTYFPVVFIVRRDAEVRLI